MKIGLIGLGSIGSVLSFKLLLDEQVKLYVVSGRINSDIKLKENGKDNILTSRKFNKVDMDTLFNMNDIDVIIISGKINKNQEIIEKIKTSEKLLPPILLAQNGINNEAEFLEIPNIIIYRMVVSISAYIDDNDVTVFNFFKPPLVYGPVSITTSLKPKLLMDILTAQEIPTILVDNTTLKSSIWTKGVINCGLNALSALYLSKMNKLHNHSYIFTIVDNIVNEAYNVAQQIGVDFDKRKVIDMIKMAPSNYSSMYKDIVTGKDTEIDYLNGMIVKLGEDNKINTDENNKITILIKGLDKSIPSNNKSLCNEELEIIKNIFLNDVLINNLKNFLNSVIEKLFNIGFDKKSFFSDDKNEMGNIGTDNIDENYLYILSDNATIREKVNSIVNTFFDSIKKKPKEDSINLINFIFTHNTEWNKQRIEQLKKITNKNTIKKLYKYIIKNKFFDLWAPIIHIYPEFVFKRHLSKNISTPITCDGWKSEIIEPFSEKEKKYYGESMNFFTGKCYYSNVLELIKKNNSCSVAGISGHTLLLLELVKVLDVDWKPMILCILLTNVPYHHSIDEIIRCIFTMKLDDSYKEKSNEDIIFEIIKDMLSQTGGKIIKYKKNKKPKTKNKKTKNKRTKNKRTKNKTRKMKIKYL